MIKKHCREGDLYGAIDSRRSYERFVGVDTKLAISAAYVGVCCQTIDVVLLCADKFGKV